jgi:predicted RecA/RadA family phage recombinase
MNAVFRQRGDAVDYIPEADVSAGDVVVQNDLVGVAKLDIKAGERGALALTGVYAVTKATGAGAAIEAGVKLQWNATGAIVTPDTDDGGSPATVYPYLGKSTLAAGDDDETVQVRLDQ